MRDDPSLPADFSDSGLWDRQRYHDKLVGQDAGGTWWSHSLSGNERNRLFLHTGAKFTDVSLVSGADDLADARSWCRIDYDGDGYQDIALMSLNHPRFKLYRNNLKTISPASRPPLRIRLTGTVSNRDAVGAKVEVIHQSGASTVLHRQCGEGFASQNSPVLSLGIPGSDPVTSLRVRWPSGITSDHPPGRPAEIVEIREPPRTAPANR